MCLDKAVLAQGGGGGTTPVVTQGATGAYKKLEAERKQLHCIQYHGQAICDGDPRLVKMILRAEGFTYLARNTISAQQIVMYTPESYSGNIASVTLSGNGWWYRFEAPAQSYRRLMS